MASTKSKPEKVEEVEEVETVEVPLCGNINKDYRSPAYVKGEKDPNVLKCTLLEGHEGDHFAEKDSAGHTVRNGNWLNGTGRVATTGPTQFPETLPPGLAERLMGS